jgi:hypothetical protein
VRFAWPKLSSSRYSDLATAVHRKLRMRHYLPVRSRERPILVWLTQFGVLTPTPRDISCYVVTSVGLDADSDSLNALRLFVIERQFVAGRSLSPQKLVFA